ncbi:hypothetical protein [Paenibacillus soyae]|uniref:Hemerythrin-like domain-containing protein n=1 Tax=Paenibacillus soyae TaxID=2969249 RepID=A0A9X2MQQ3_9BACL|nr:hypothetical protein [Paenibacillus soyae]MCR2804046.1 hypothetical protein [Paenibacillus soyae]
MQYYHLVDRNALKLSCKSQFLQHVKRLENKQAYLNRRADALHELSLSVPPASGSHHMLGFLTEVKAKASSLQQALTCHAEWETEQLFAALRGLLRPRKDPELLHCFMLLEHDLAIALDYLGLFLKQADAILYRLRRGGEPLAYALHERWKQASQLLIQACLIVKCHLDVERQRIIPLLDEIMVALRISGRASQSDIAHSQEAAAVLY